MSEAGCCPKTRQGVAERFLATPPCWLSHRLLIFKRLLKGLQSDGPYVGAGDEFELATACLEGRYLQHHRSLALKCLYRPV